MSESGTLSAVLRRAANIMLALDAGRLSLDDALDGADAALRRILEHLLLNFYRYRKSISSGWRRFATRPPAPEVSALLDAAATQIRCQRGVAPQSAVNVAVTLAKRAHADKFVNAVLRRFAAEAWTPPTAPDAVLPDPILRRWRREFTPAEVEKLAETFVTPAPFTFRLCRDAAVPPDCAELPGNGPFRFASGDARKILASPEFAAGAYYVQDPAAAVAATLALPELPRCRTVLDLCAAPGGKALMLAEHLASGAELTAADRSGRRQELTRDNFRRHGLNARILTAAPEELTGTYDLTLADVPCSNTGVFRRRPDVLWRFSEASLADVMAMQKPIVAQAARLTAPGGTLIVSTCSIETDENSALIGIAEAAGCRLVETATRLPDVGGDGAFAAKFVR